MKKIFCAIILLVLTFSAFAFSGCSDKTPDAISSKYENLADDGKFLSDSGEKGEEAVFDFGRTVLINTVVLKEKDSNITSFRIYVNDGETPVYGNDYIGGYRYCAFAPTEASKIRVEVMDCDGKWKLEEVEAYLILNKAESFDVMSYINADTAYTLTQEQAEIASCVTQFNVFGCTYFDAEGEIHFVEYTIDGKTVSGQEVLKKAIENLRKANPSATIVFTVLANRDFGDGMTTIERHNSAMNDHAAVLTENLLKIIDEYGLDGVSFDYEYPEKSKDFKTFSNYIKQLDAALPEGKLLTAAISDWCIRTFGYSAKDLEPLDSIEIMSYDLFDERGNHATFYNTCYKTLKDLDKKGVDMSKVHLGLPFYSRPVDKSAFWGSYKDVAGILGPYDNALTEEFVDLDGVQHAPTKTYYNGRQMIYDKTRYAIDCGIGGVMIWHFGCDTTDPELSLFKQIEAAINGEYTIS